MARENTLNEWAVATNTGAATTSNNRRRELLLFFAATFGVTWGIAALLLLIPDVMTRWFGQFSTSSPLYFAAVYAPSGVAVVLTIFRHGWKRTLDLLATLVPQRSNVLYYVAVLSGGLVLNRLALLLQGVITGEPTPWIDFSRWYLAPVLLLSTLAADPGPLGEELGWRGYALPRLLAGRLSTLASAIVLGVIWGVWHLPAFFVAGTAQHDTGMGIVWLILGTIMSSVVMTWLYLRTKAMFWPPGCSCIS
jgi:membrane protease YdiL (CAAX protease family)